MQSVYLHDYICRRNNLGTASSDINNLSFGRDDLTEDGFKDRSGPWKDQVNLVVRFSLQLNCLGL